ncbi:MAG TPA: response regulator, partial [Aquabacterium sp.]|nr:response regulator [Aquabacterium sp.]
KQMELRLRFSQDLLDRTGRIAGVGGWQYEPLNGKLDWSDQNYRIFDLAPGDAARPDDPLAYIPEPGRSALQEAARAAVDAGRAWDMEVPALTAAGRAIWIRAVGEAEFENGVAVRMVGATQDITAQRDARERLDRATQLLRSVLDAATEIAVISTDARLDIVVFNAGAERLLGYRAEEVVGCESPSLFHDPMEVRLRALSMSEELGQPVVGMEVFTHPSVHGVPRDWTFVRKDGSRVPVSLVITPQTAEDGHIMGYVGVAHDITPRLQYEATLRQSMMQAEQVSLAKSQFLANMSHEIRTPMNAILGMLKLLQQTPLTERQREYTSKTEGAARALLALLNDILDFSKVEAGKMVLDRHPFALENVLQDLALMLSANVGIKPVELLFDVDPALLSTRLLGDDLRLLQVLINLGGNAVKFTMVGEVVVSLAQRARTAEQVSVRVAVRDTGIGIAPGALGQIFEGFSQAEASTTRRFGGSGLGLAICRRLVELMGGELQVRSELGQGSEFWFDVDLPIVNEAPPADALPPARHVLVVDDNPSAREVLARQVHSLGWTCELASDADTALAALQQGLASGRPYQVVLLDWRMPGSDGLALTQAIRAAHGRVEGRPDLQIIVMVSAHDREELAQRSGLLPFRIDGYLVKPVTPGLLAEAVGASPSRPRAVDTAAAVPNGAGRLAGLHLLLVEDNPNNRQIAEELLSAEGARIDIAVNGQEGVQAIVAADGNYDAVLMDVQMPVMDGLSAAQRVRELLGARTPPIIAMTAHASEADRAASAAAGMVDHISKPFDLSHLVRVLRHHAGRPEQVAPPPAAPTALPEAVLTVATELGIDIQAAWER